MEEITNQLREVKVIIPSGSSVMEDARRIGVSEQTFFRGRTECGSLLVD